jgi:Protein of unknown function (DUF3052)
MGDEARCTVRYGDRVSAGKALLETEELVFRGDFRLKVPLREIRSVEADDGRLEIVFAGGEASFELGPRAVRWAERIRNPKTLLDKLGLKPGLRVAVLGLDDGDFRELLRAKKVDFSEEAVAEADAIVFRAESSSDLDRLGELRGLLQPNGMIWVVAPKGGREPREADVLAAGKKAGLVDVKVARFSDTHTAHKLVIPVARR